MKSTTGLAKPGLLQYIVCYLIFVVLALATVWLALQVRTNLIGMTLPFSGMDYRMAGLLDKVSIILMGFVTLLIIILLEHVLRTAMIRHRFWPRVLRIVVIEAVVVAFSYGANIVIMKLLLHA